MISAIIIIGAAIFVIAFILFIVMDSFKYNKNKINNMSKLKQRILTVAIAIMLVLFIGFGIDTFYKPPKYNDFCNNQYGPYPVKDGRTIINCSNEAVQTQTLIDSCNVEKGYLAPKYDDNGCVASYYCETCQIKFDDANKAYNGVVFTFALILGIISMVIAVVLKNDTVSPGILGGGFLSILYGTIRDWSNLGDYLRLALLGVALAILIWIGYKKMNVDETELKKVKKK